MNPHRLVDRKLTRCSEAGYKFQPSHSVSVTFIFVDLYKQFICPKAALIEQADLFSYFLPLIESRIREG